MITEDMSVLPPIAILLRAQSRKYLSARTRKVVTYDSNYDTMGKT